MRGLVGALLIAVASTLGIFGDPNLAETILLLLVGAWGWGYMVGGLL